MQETARITGVSAGDNVLAESPVKGGLTGATLSLTVESLPGIIFPEMVVAGSIAIDE